MLLIASNQGGTNCFAIESHWVQSREARPCQLDWGRLTAPPEAATTHEKNMYHVKLAVKALSVAPPGIVPPAMAPASKYSFETCCKGEYGGCRIPVCCPEDIQTSACARVCQAAR